METWKDIPGFEGRYQASDAGRVRSVDRRVRVVVGGVETTRLAKGKVLRPAAGKSGHLSVALGKGRTVQVHQAIAWAFLGPQAPSVEVAHNDGDPTHNAPSNLRYDSRSGNGKDRVHHGATRLSVEQVEFIRVNANRLPRGGKKALAAQFRVSPTTISDVLAGRTYSHV
jgi:hypothetical protein